MKAVLILKILLPPLLGGVIGYITNDIAIKMLFHPRKPIYIGKWKLPLTPGLIPKEKHRIAQSIGKVIGEQLLDSSTLEKVFTSEEILQKIRTGLENLVEKNRDNEDTLQTVLQNFSSEETSYSVEEDIKENAANLIHKKLTEAHISEKISLSILTRIAEKLETYSFGMLSPFIDKSLIESISRGVGDLITTIISDNSKQMIRKLIDTEFDKFKNQRVCDLIEKYEHKLPQATDFIINIYVRTIQENLAGILKGINIEKVVQERIDSFDVMELEQIIFSIMKKELKAIVYLGAALGFIMGWINLLLIG